MQKNEKFNVITGFITIFMITVWAVSITAYGGVIWQDDFTGEELDPFWSFQDLRFESTVVQEDGKLIISSYRDPEDGGTPQTWAGTDVSQDFNFLTEPRTFEIRNYNSDQDWDGENWQSSTRRRIKITINSVSGAPSPHGSTDNPGHAGIQLRMNRGGGLSLGFSNQGEEGWWHHAVNNVINENMAYRFDASADLIRLTVSDTGYDLYMERNDGQDTQSWSGLWADSGVSFNSDGWENGAAIILGQNNHSPIPGWKEITEWGSVTVIPEPGSLALLAMAGLALLYRRRY